MRLPQFIRRLLRREPEKRNWVEHFKRQAEEAPETLSVSDMVDL